MPSNALRKFETVMLKDVSRILESHASLSGSNRGKRGLGHLTRGGVLLLCSAWELYLEELMAESIAFVCENSNAPDELPKEIQKTIANYIRESSHELKPLAMAGDGWKEVFKEAALIKINAINTPKPGVIDPIFRKFLAVKELSQSWSCGKDQIKDFVSARGDIAHRGGDAGYVTIRKLKDEYVPTISRSVIETDNFISQHIKDSFAFDLRPWRRRTV